MIQVRKSVFETNSSSTHSVSVSIYNKIIVCSKEEYDSFVNGDSVIYNDEVVLISYLIKLPITEQLKPLVTLLLDKKATIEDEYRLMTHYGIYTYDRYCNHADCNAAEQIFKEYNSKNDDDIVVFGYTEYECSED